SVRLQEIQKHKNQANSFTISSTSSSTPSSSSFQLGPMRTPSSDRSSTQISRNSARVISKGSYSDHSSTHWAWASALVDHSGITSVSSNSVESHTTHSS